MRLRDLGEWELLRRLAHWLMKEPALEEEDLKAHVAARVAKWWTPDEVRIVEEHLAGCSCCATCYRLEEGVRSVVREACDEPCPDQLRQQLRRICDDCDCD